MRVRFTWKATSGKQSRVSGCGKAILVPPLSSRADLFDDVVDVASFSALDVVEIKKQKKNVFYQNMCTRKMNSRMTRTSYARRQKACYKRHQSTSFKHHHNN